MSAAESPRNARLPREHLVEDRAEGEDVGAVVRALSANLLRRHVAERSQDDAWLGAGRNRGEVGLTPHTRGLGELRQAEVEDLHPAVGGDEEILGLQIAVNDPLLVRGGEAVRDADGVVHGAAGRELPSARTARSVSPSSSSCTT